MKSALFIFAILRLTVCQQLQPVILNVPNEFFPASVPAPFFNSEDNLSTKDCGKLDQNATANAWRVYVRRNNGYGCFGIIISDKAIILEERCGISDEDREISKVYVGKCASDTEYDTEECNRTSIEIQDVVTLEVHADSFQPKLLTTKKKVSNASPICLFNRGFEDNFSADSSTYLAWYMWKTENNTLEESLKERDFRRWGSEMHTARSGRKKQKPVLATNLPYFLINDYFGYTPRTTLAVVNIYKGRYFLRGIRSFFKDTFHDIYPFISLIAKHVKEISVMPTIPLPEPPREFSGSDNLSFPQCGIKPLARFKRSASSSETEESLEPGTLLLGGYESQHNQHPWYALLRNVATGITCGATLISRRAVLTAGHCIFEAFARDIYITIGMYNMKFTNDPNIQTKTPSEVITHPNYTSIPSNDIGLAIFKDGYTVTDFVRPICLWNEDSSLEQVAGKTAVVAGYGLVDNYTRPDRLQELQLPIIAHKKCYLSQRRFFGKYLKPGTNFCAGHKNGSLTCQGDSGGGLTLEKEGRWFIRGIVSFGAQKKEPVPVDGQLTAVCHPDHYTLFEDVASHMAWIVENTPDVSFKNQDARAQN